MLTIPHGWTIHYVTREDCAARYQEHADEIMRSFGWCAGRDQALYIFVGPWLVGWYWIREHEVTHAIHREKGWPVQDCDDPSCIMARTPDYGAALDRWIRYQDWHCEECRRRMEVVRR